MVQFNLLPDVKLKYIRARRTQHLMALISLIVIAVSVVVFILMFTTVNVVQKKSLSDLKKDIKADSATLTGTEDLNKILTVQNQLNTLDGLHADKPVASRLFSYLTQVTPPKATIASLHISFTDSTVNMSGDAPSLDVVNAYTDTLKATTYTTADGGTTSKNAFSDVVLSSFGRTSQGATYTISFTFDPVIFNSASDVSLHVPAGPTVDPAALFHKDTGGGQ